MATSTTSFVKKLNTAPQLYKSQRGVKPYPNQQYSVSSGNPSLDYFIGGGYPVGSIVLQIEDSFSHYHSHFLKGYMAEGIVNEHKVLIVDPVEYREKEYWLKILPAVYKIKDSNETTKNQTSSEEEEKKSNTSTPCAKQEQLKVAWRYNNLLDE